MKTTKNKATTSATPSQLAQADIGTNTVTKYHIISPDGLPLTFEPLASKTKARQFIRAFCQNLKHQGYYAAANCRIPLTVLPKYLRIVAENEVLSKCYPIV